MWSLLLPAAWATEPPPTALRAPLAGLRPPVHVAADLDGDGVLDLAWLEDERLWWAPGVRGGPPAIDRDARRVARVSGVLALAAADLDVDGVADLVAADPDGVFRVFPGSASGPGPAGASLGPAIGLVVGIGDANGDGAGDLAVGARVWLSSPGGPVEGPLLPAGDRLIGVGDLDGDGFDDLVATDPGPAGAYGEREAPLRLFPGGPGGPATSPAWTWAGGGDCGWGAAPVDLDADGEDELAVACLTVADESATGALVALDDLLSPAGPTVLGATGVDFDLGQGFLLRSAGDALRLGWLGRVQALPWDDGFQPDDETGPRWVLPPGAALSSATTDDLDGDGLPDLAVAWSDPLGVGSLAVWTTATGLQDTGGTGAPAAGADPGRGCGCASPGGGAVGWVAGLAALTAIRRGRGCRRPTPRRSRR